MDIVSLIRMIRRKWVLILLLTSFVVFIAFYLSFYYLETQYEATSTLIVQVQQSDRQMVYNDLLTGQKLVGTYNQIVKSKFIANDVIDTLQLSMSANELLAKIRVEAPSDSLITSITVRDTELEQAVAIANEFAESFSRNLGRIMTVDNVSILDRATTEDASEPVSPNPILNLSIAFVMGLLLSIGLAVLIEQMDRTIVTEEQIEEALGLAILGVIPRISAKDIRKIRNRTKLGGETTEEQGKQSKVNLPT